jgi:hypothetical protein
MDYWSQNIFNILIVFIVSFIFLISAAYISVKGKFHPNRMNIFSQAHFRRTQRLYISREKDLVEFNRSLYFHIIMGIIFFILGLIILIDMNIK